MLYVITKAIEYSRFRNMVTIIYCLMFLYLTFCVLSDCDPKPRECNDIFVFSYQNKSQREYYQHKKEIIYIEDKPVQVILITYI